MGTAGPGVESVMEVETNQLPLENTLIISFRKITVLHIPLIDHIVGKFSNGIYTAYYIYIFL